MRFKHHDGGRKDSGLKGRSHDCVIRAYCIATGEPYIKTRDKLKIMTSEMTYGMDASVADGVYPPVYSKMFFLSGFTPVKRNGYMSDVPKTGTHIVCMTGHIATVIDGVLYDTWDSSTSKRTKSGEAKISGYWSKQ